MRIYNFIGRTALAVDAIDGSPLGTRKSVRIPRKELSFLVMVPRRVVLVMTWPVKVPASLSSTLTWSTVLAPLTVDESVHGPVVGHTWSP